MLFSQSHHWSQQKAALFALIVLWIMIKIIAIIIKTVCSHFLAHCRSFDDWLMRRGDYSITRPENWIVWSRRKWSFSLVMGLVSIASWWYRLASLFWLPFHTLRSAKKRSFARNITALRIGSGFAWQSILGIPFISSHTTRIEKPARLRLDVEWGSGSFDICSNQSSAIWSRNQFCFSS